jgi:hypothetical protein
VAIAPAVDHLNETRRWGEFDVRTRRIVDVVNLDLVRVIQNHKKFLLGGQSRHRVSDSDLSDLVPELFKSNKLTFKYIIQILIQQVKAKREITEVFPISHGLATHSCRCTSRMTGFAFPSPT